jgi:hypothetical protein
MRSKREKIILAIMAFAFAWGIFNFVRNAKKPDDKPPAQPTDIQSMEQLAASTSGLQTTAYTDTIRAILEKAGSAWDLNPFAALAAGTTAVQQSGQPQFVYSGFALMQGRKIAIINGREYRKGDKLPFGDYVVESIDTNSVTLRNSTDGKEESIEKVEQTTK